MSSTLILPQSLAETQVIRLLHERGAPLNIQNAKKMTPLGHHHHQPDLKPDPN